MKNKEIPSKGNGSSTISWKIVHIQQTRIQLLTQLFLRGRRNLTWGKATAQWQAVPDSISDGMYRKMSPI